MKKKKEGIEFAFISLTVILILYRDLVNDSLPLSCFSVICGLAAFCLNTSGRFLYIVALLPFCRGLPYSEMILIVLICEFMLIVLTHKKIGSAVLYVWLMMICTIELLDYLRFDVASMEIVYLLAYMVFVTYAVSNKVYHGRENKFIWYYGVSTVLATLSVIIREVNYYGWDYIFTYNLRFGGYIAGKTVTNFNANELGLYCVMATALFLTMYHQKKNTRSLVFAIVATVLGVLSVSRTYLLVVIITWFVFLFINGMRVKRIVAAVGLMAVIMVFAVIWLPDVTDWILRFFMNRANEENTRINLMVLYFDKIFSSVWTVLFGYSQSYLSLLLGETSAAVHNGPQEVLVCWGFLGAGVFAVWVMGVYRSSGKQTASVQKVYYLSAMSFWIFIQALQLVTMHNYLLVMLLTIIPISMGEGRRCIKTCQS